MGFKSLHKLIEEKIERSQKKIIGHALSTPYLSTIGGQSIWVVDVLVYSESDYLEAIPLAESGRSVRDFVNEGTPVELSRSNAGQFYITGLSDRKRGSLIKKTYSITDAGFGFTEGFRKDSDGTWISGNSNEIDTGTEETTEYSYSAEPMPYGDLDYGTTPYGATKIVRTP